MTTRRIAVGVMMLLVAALMTACEGRSCLPGSVSTTAPVTSASGATTSTTARPPSTTIPPTTTSTSTTSTTIPTTTTTLGPLEAYRAEMRAWRNRYGAELGKSYGVIGAMRDPVRPSAEEVQAATDLDLVLADMVDDLEDIKPPPVLAATHAAYLDSMQEMADGAHDLSEAMKGKRAIRTLAAMTTLAVAWEKGEPARTALESALGFSLSG